MQGQICAAGTLVHASMVHAAPALVLKSTPTERLIACHARGVYSVGEI